MKIYSVLTVLWAIGAILSLGQESDHESHENGEHFEQAAVYSMAVGNSNLIVMPSGNAITFAEETFAFMVVPASTADEEGLEEAEESAVEGTDHVSFDLLDPNAFSPILLSLGITGGTTRTSL